MRQLILLPFILFFYVADGQCIRINDSAVECSFNILGIKTNTPVFSHRAFKFDKSPAIYIVDGVVTDEAEIQKLDPDTIESISLLNTKDFAKIISCRPPGVVIVIVTKAADQRTIIVKDMLNGEVLAGATVEISSIEQTKNTFHLIADSFGRVVTNKIVPGKEYEIRVSNVGYKTYTTSLNAAMTGKNYSVALERNYLEAAEVVIVSGTVCVLRKVIRHSCQKITACQHLEETQVAAPDKIKARTNLLQELKIYPNPARRSQNINIEFENKNDSKMTIRMFSLDNKLVTEKEYSVNEGMNRISHFINLRLASGVYIVQVIDTTNRFTRTAKIIVR